MDLRTPILGVGISAMTMQSTLEAIDEYLRIGRCSYVCVTGVHGVMECQRDPELMRIHNDAALVTPDGMPLVWLSRLRGARHVERVYGPDLMLAVCEHRNYRHFFYGGAEGIADRLAGNLQRRFPGLQVAGTFTPPFRPLTEEEDERLVQLVRDAKPDIVWVGLSTPKQERWMRDHVNRFEGMLLIGVGAAFDFHAGAKRQAPRWMQRSGLEWLFRLLTEPRRLARRYLTNNPRFVLKVLMEELAARSKTTAPTR